MAYFRKLDESRQENPSKGGIVTASQLHFDEDSNSIIEPQGSFTRPVSHHAKTGFTNMSKPKQRRIVQVPPLFRD